MIPPDRVILNGKVPFGITMYYLVYTKFNMVVPFDYALQTIIKINSRSCIHLKCSSVHQMKKRQK